MTYTEHYLHVHQVTRKDTARSTLEQYPSLTVNTESSHNTLKSMSLPISVEMHKREATYGSNLTADIWSQNTCFRF